MIEILMKGFGITIASTEERFQRRYGNTVASTEEKYVIVGWGMRCVSFILVGLIFFLCSVQDLI